MSKIDSSPASAVMPKVESNVSKEEQVQMRRVANQMEALFVNHLMSEMRKTVSKGGLIQESQGERVFRTMLDAEYSQNIAESQQLGLSDLVYEHLLRSRLGR